MLIRLGNVREMLLYGIKSPIYWDTSKVPHCLLAGPTGGGKTVASQLVVNQLLDSCIRKEIGIEDIYICDFKAGGDWDSIVPNYAEYEACDDIFHAFYESFADAVRQKQYREKYLIFDEFSSYALYKDSKGFKELMSKLGHLAFMGRSFGYHLLFIGQQISTKILV